MWCMIKLLHEAVGDNTEDYNILIGRFLVPEEPANPQEDRGWIVLAILKEQKLPGNYSRWERQARAISRHMVSEMSVARKCSDPVRNGSVWVWQGLQDKEDVEELINE